MSTREFMICRRCSSNKLNKFGAEMNVHFPGWEGLEKPSVGMFTEIAVCLDCGFAEFFVPEAELPKLGTTRQRSTCPSPRIDL